MPSNIPYLSIAIWLPIIIGFISLIIGGKKRQNFVKFFSLFGALISFLFTIPIILNFQSISKNFQFIEKFVWIERFNVFYYLGIDGLSLWFIPLTALMTLIVIIFSWKNVDNRISQYMGSFLILSGLMIGVFCSLDAILFYIFFEATLIPMFIIIGIWGGARRVYASIKFFLYTFLGSLLMLVALIYLYFESENFFIQNWHFLPLDLKTQIYIFCAFFIAFAVKVPMWPVHTWLPDAHVEAPTGGSVILAAIMLKIGGYGFLRFSLPITPDASIYLSEWVIFLSLVAIIYVGLVALIQSDMKKLIAYSSIAHMGFVTLGFFIFSHLGLIGGIMQMISHGFISGAMFLCIGVLYDRLHSRNIKDYGGVVTVMPKFATLFVLFSFANAGLPGTSGFIGEFMVILGSVKFNFWIGLLSAFALILGASYSLWLVKRVIFGVINNHKVSSIKDLDYREFSILLILAVFVLSIGFYPAYFTDMIQVSVNNLLNHVAISKIP